MRIVAARIACTAWIALAPVAAGFQSTTTRVSVDSVGVQGNAHSFYSIALSADGRFVAFHSLAGNLVAGDTNWAWDVFVRDRSNGTTERVSVNSAGVQGNGNSQPQINHALSISADGRFVAFQSYASNLAPSDTNNGADIFVRDRLLGTTEHVSVSPTGGPAQGGGICPSISADGRFVAFGSWASKLAIDINDQPDMFVRDRQLGTIELVSVSTGGMQGNEDSVQHGSAISADGRFVAFGSWASNLVVGDTNSFGDVFVRDRQLGTTERASLSTAGMQGNGTSISPSISADGRFVAFTSMAGSLVVGDTNSKFDVFVRDRFVGTTERVSMASGAIQGDDDSSTPSISADGRFVAFSSDASNLVPGDTNGTADAFVHDRQNRTTERVSLSTGGAEGEAYSVSSAISADSRIVAFSSWATNLVAGDTNGVLDVFVRDRPGQPASYCTAGTSSSGCSASVEANTNPSASLAHACSITVTSVEGRKSGLLFYGIDNSGFTPLPWASGSASLLCVKPPTQRTSVQFSGGSPNACDGSFVLDWSAFQLTHPVALGNPWNMGAKVHVQAWFRDPPAVKSTNLSQALEMTYMP